MNRAVDKIGQTRKAAKALASVGAIAAALGLALGCAQNDPQMQPVVPSTDSDGTYGATNAMPTTPSQPASATPMDQNRSKDDVRITADIRRGVVGDASLSSTAKNVKIVTSGGKVVLRGPVDTAEERATIEAKARATAGVTDVDDQLEVKP